MNTGVTRDAQRHKVLVGIRATSGVQPDSASSRMRRGHSLIRDTYARSSFDAAAG